MSEPVSVLIVEDHHISLCGIRMILEEQPHFTVIGEAVDGKSAVEMALKLKPELIIMDIGLPELDGIEATQQIKAALPTTRVIILTSHDQDDDVFAALAAGADGYCLKDISCDQIVAVAEAVVAGNAWLDPRMAKRVLKTVSGDAPTPTQPETKPFGLTNRELEVLELIVAGSTNQQIATALFVSMETVKTHVRHIMEKLCVSDRTQAAVKGVRQGLGRS